MIYLEFPVFFATSLSPPWAGGKKDFSLARAQELPAAKTQASATL
jgi:hypothetical protein